MSKKKSGWEDLLKCAQLCRKQLWHLCWSTANKHPISRSILSLQTLHIFLCVEQYFFFSMILCLLRIQNVQSAPNMVCVCHSTCYQIKSFISPSAVLPQVLLISLMCHFVFKCEIQQTCRQTHRDTHTYTCTKWQHSTTGHLYPECLPSCGLTSFFALLPLLSNHPVFYYGIGCALFKCKQDLMSFHVCSCVLVLRGRVLWT